MPTRRHFRSSRVSTTITEISDAHFVGNRWTCYPGLYLKKTIQTLDGVLWVGGYASHPINPRCKHSDVHYLSKHLAAP